MLFNLRHVIYIPPCFRIVNLLWCGGHFNNITFIGAKNKYRSPYFSDFSQPYLQNHIRMSLESPQDVVRKRLLELNIRPYGDLKRSVWDVTWRTLWGNPQDIIFQRPKDVGRRPP